MSAYDTSTEIEYDQDSDEYKITIPTDILEEMEWQQGDIIELEFHDYEGLPGLRIHRVGE
jgi:hypothetical protein